MQVSFIYMGIKNVVLAHRNGKIERRKATEDEDKEKTVKMERSKVSTNFFSRRPNYTSGPTVSTGSLLPEGRSSGLII